MAIEYLPVAWSQYHTLARQMAGAILSGGIHIDEVVAISRGGLTLGHLLTDLLRVPISTFTIQSYTDIREQGEVKITKPLTTPIYDKHVLLVDDVSDSGKTIQRALEYLKTQQPKNVTTLTMFYKPHSVFKPDYYAQETSAWILFPYEPTEMITNMMKSMKKEGKSEKEIDAFLHSLNYQDDQIAFVKKHYPA